VEITIVGINRFRNRYRMSFPVRIQWTMYYS